MPRGLLARLRVAFSRVRYAYQRARGQIRTPDPAAEDGQAELFVAGLPKSGTSWLEGMLADFANHQTIMLPEAVAHEMEHGGSHEFELPADTFRRLEGDRYVLKLHLAGSRKNARILAENRIRYVVMYRDLRDVAVSYCFYVMRTPWHPEFETYHALSIEDALHRFSRTLLPVYARWIESWHRVRDEDLSTILRYEDLLAETEAELGRVLAHFGFDAETERVRRVVRDHSFERVSGGRERGTENLSSFVRKGVHGDWKNYFSPPLRERFHRVAGDALRLGGYS